MGVLKTLNDEIKKTRSFYVEEIISANLTKNPHYIEVRLMKLTPEAAARKSELYKKMMGIHVPLFGQTEYGKRYVEIIRLLRDEYEKIAGPTDVYLVPIIYDDKGARIPAGEAQVLDSLPEGTIKKSDYLKTKPSRR